MEKKTVVFIVLIFSCFATGGIVPELQIDGTVYSTGAEISLSQGIHFFTFYTDDTFHTTGWFLTLRPFYAAHFVPESGIVLPMGYTSEYIGQIMPPFWEDYDVWFISPPQPPVSPVPPFQGIQVAVEFIGPEAEFAIWTSDDCSQIASWSLIPEPATITLLALGALLSKKKIRSC